VYCAGGGTTFSANVNIHNFPAIYVTNEYFCSMLLCPIILLIFWREIICISKYLVSFIFPHLLSLPIPHPLLFHRSSNIFSPGLHSPIPQKVSLLFKFNFRRYHLPGISVILNELEYKKNFVWKRQKIEISFF
jgi:hypothetical protein